MFIDYTPDPQPKRPRLNNLPSGRGRGRGRGRGQPTPGISGTPARGRGPRGVAGDVDEVDTCNDEMKQFLAIDLLMGLVNLLSIEMYWTTKVLFNVPVFNLLMTRNRFQL
ncbi:hypothetical protein KUTeg_021977 [Tegillarca granosa]|uniref:PiggyBac transposable element-derived protein domain-containing protein n=1 Tax=Tegillarca granosa TaxID=220873 RepID=A0ABQ9E4X8_TEGGR|nr:hypothetical protein KUTeg_021977 [Tegillarca granosa]